MPTQTIAFFGATGGIAGTSLARALTAGHTCTALVRTPTKLHTQLTTTHAVPPTTISTHLATYEGNVKDAAAVAKALVSPRDKTHLVDTIYFGVGAAPKFTLNPLRPVTLDDTHVCESGIRAVFAALASLDTPTTTADGRKPLLILISTTGIRSSHRDTPALYSVLYPFFLHVPHVDKQAMEDVALADGGKHVRDVVVVKPTLLVEGASKAVRVGWVWADGRGKGAEEEEGEGRPALGYVICRRDVGDWIYENVVVGGGGGWEGRSVSLTS